MDVSICIMTYNHEEYIKKAMDSVLNQKTNLSYEIIVADDASTDQTVEIVMQYGKKVHLMRNETNQGIGRNIARLYAAASGKYILVLAGDDWFDRLDYIDILYNYMEHNPDYIGAFCNRKIYTNDEQYICNLESSYIETGIEDMLWNNDHPQDAMIVKNIFSNLPDWVYDVSPKTNEIGMQLYIFMHGKIGVVPELCYGYRRAPESGGSNYNSLYKRMDIYLQYKDGVKNLYDNVTRKYNFDYVLNKMGAWALKEALSALIKKHEVMLYKRYRRETTILDRVKHTKALILLYFNNWQYPAWYTKRRIVVHDL